MLNWEKYVSLSKRYLRFQALLHSISPVDVEDIRQNVFLHILRHRASVVAMSAAELENFIDRTVSKCTKRWKRYQVRFRPMEDDQTPTVNEMRQGELNELGLAILKLDVAAILDQMTARQQSICQCLIDDKTPRRIMGIVKCSPVTMKTELEQIRRQFFALDYCQPHANEF